MTSLSDPLWKASYSLVSSTSMGTGEGVRDTSEISSPGSSSLSDLELDLERWSEEEPGGSKAAEVTAAWRVRYLPDERYCVPTGDSFLRHSERSMIRGYKGLRELETNLGCCLAIEPVGKQKYYLIVQSRHMLERHAPRKSCVFFESSSFNALVRPFYDKSFKTMAN